MSDRQVQTEIAGLLEAARPELTSELEARAVAAVAATRPARSRRWIAVAVGAAVALFGLGFVPFPAGGAKGAFSKALALTSQEGGVHVTGRIWGPSGEWNFEQWFSQDGFKRFDLLDGDGVVQRWVYEPAGWTIRPKDPGDTEPVWRLNKIEEQTGQQSPRGEWLSSPLIGPDAEVHDALTDQREDVMPYPWVRQQSQKPTREDFLARVGSDGALEVKVEEHRRYSLWRGRQTIVADVYGHRPKDSWADVLILGNLMGPVFPWLKHGDDLWIHVEADPETGALLRLEMYKRANGVWQLGYCVDSIETGVELGPEVRAPGIPDGHVRVEDTWWRDRLGTTLQVGQTEDWQVALHSLEVNRLGELFVTLSRRPRVEVPPDMDSNHKLNAPLRSLIVEAVDDFGNHYMSSAENSGVGSEKYGPGAHFGFVEAPPDCDARVRLLPGKPLLPGARPNTLTLTVTTEPAVREVRPREVGEAVERRLRQEYGEGPEFRFWLHDFLAMREVGWGTRAVTFARLPMPLRQEGEDLIGQAIQVTER